MATFAFRILELDGSLHPVPESRAGASGVFVLPLGLEDFSERTPSRTQVLHVPGGVAIDRMGLSPSTFTLRWTFGSKEKVVGGQRFTPLELYNDLRRFLLHYHDSNLLALQDGTPVELIFDNFEYGHHWVVEPTPSGLPEVRHNANTPTRPSFNLTLQGVRPFGRQPVPADDVARRLTPDAQREVLATLDAYGLAEVAELLP